MMQRGSNSVGLGLLACTVVLVMVGCDTAPGKPGAEPEVPRPEQVLDFTTLYAENCAACHGEHGKNGAAISLANPVYLDIAGVTNVERVTTAGVPGTAMPPFGKTAGGGLTDRQIAVLADGMERAWGNPTALAGQTGPAYASNATGNPEQGARTFGEFCARCHGGDGNGGAANGVVTGSLVDPSYLALISDQGLRSFILAGQTEQGAHDWRGYLAGQGARAMTDAEVTDTVAWLTSHRSTASGQVYKQHP